MTYLDIRAVLGRERQNTLRAGAGLSAGTRSVVSWLSAPRIIDVPFEMCVAVLESWQRTGQGSELHIGKACCAGRSSGIATPVPAESRLA
jgi:hypothetical protein